MNLPIFELQIHHQIRFRGSILNADYVTHGSATLLDKEIFTKALRRLHPMRIFLNESSSIGIVCCARSQINQHILTHAPIRLHRDGVYYEVLKCFAQSFEHRGASSNYCFLAIDLGDTSIQGVIPTVPPIEQSCLVGLNTDYDGMKVLGMKIIETDILAYGQSNGCNVILMSNPIFPGMIGGCVLGSDNSSFGLIVDDTIVCNMDQLETVENSTCDSGVSTPTSRSSTPTSNGNDREQQQEMQQFVQEKRLAVVLTWQHIVNNENELLVVSKRRRSKIIEQDFYNQHVDIIDDDYNSNCESKRMYIDSACESPLKRSLYLELDE